ncbi:MAG: ABC transporter substrate-binding protein [Candidatus Rokuibacteriota bacterium]|nr:MAG: ABC transporter substrate-binding protein [Candidatus Rokubacteria bacterium]
MRRIGLAVVLAVNLLAVPVAPEAQQGTKVPRVGLLDYAAFRDPLLEMLRDLGYVEGQSITFEYRRSEGRSERLPDLAAELVRLKVDVIVSYGTPATRAAQQATTGIPIVMVGIGDPLRTGLVASLGRPGGNITGNTILGPEIVTKRLQLLKEAIPKLSRVTLIYNPTNPSNALNLQELRAAAPTLGVTLQSVKVSRPDEFEGAFAALTTERPDALIVTADPLHQLHIKQIVAFTAKRRLPAMYQEQENVIAGGLISYGPSIPEFFRRAAVYVDRILKGAKPADLPVEQPTKFELVINLKTAKALGLTIPQTLLLRADQVIE